MTEEKATIYSREQLLGIYATYNAIGATPEGISLEDIIELGETQATVADVAGLINAMVSKDRQLIEKLIDDNGVQDIILRDNLNVTTEMVEDARQKRDAELAEYVKEMKAQWALAQAEAVAKRDKEARGE